MHIEQSIPSLDAKLLFNDLYSFNTGTQTGGFLPNKCLSKHIPSNLVKAEAFYLNSASSIQAM